MSKESGQYEVGYGKPPAATRYQKGQSGNLKGRPHKKQNMAEMIQRVLNEKVPITLNGRRRLVTSIEASLHVLRTKAISGDLKAIRLLQDLFNRYSAQSDPEPLSSDAHLAILDDILARATGRGPDNPGKKGLDEGPQS